MTYSRHRCKHTVLASLQAEALGAFYSDETPNATSSILSSSIEGSRTNLDYCFRLGGNGGLDGIRLRVGQLLYLQQSQQLHLTLLAAPRSLSRRRIKLRRGASANS